MNYAAVFFCVAVISLVGCRGKAVNEKPLFETLDSTKTGIGFVNRLRDTDQMNMLDYLYFYNGGGVAAGDLNNDGLPDLYFVSNQGKNKLYLNRTTPGEDFRFEDVTEKAGVGGRQADWQTGVTLADINGDGRLDIYVCAVSKFRGLRGRNELYINNGTGPDGQPTFTERAAEYGLDFAGFSTQAAFFDYDHDGDLDCFLLNHAVHTSRSFDNVAARTVRDAEAGDYLFRNDGNGHFTDVSAQAGIYQATMGYGLGVSVADLNNDGWDDIYVSNDFHEDDYYYVNNRKGGFVESIRSAFPHTSRFSMGNDVADVNNDGYPDVISLDMYPADEAVEKSSAGEDPLDIYQYKLQYGYMNQYSRNCLQISQSGRKFVDVGLTAGVAATDWSWSALLADYDNDGIKDLFIANGIVRRPNNLDYVKYLADDEQRVANGPARALDKTTIGMMPEGKVHSYLYRGTKSLVFEDKSLTWGFGTPGYANGAAYADLDNDGDLDLITNNIDAPAGLHQNQTNVLFPGRHYLKIKLQGNTANTFGVGAKVILKTRNGLQLQAMMPTRGFESSVEPVLTFGLDSLQVVDSLIVIWPNQRMAVQTNVRANQTLTLRQADATRDATGYRFTEPPEPARFADVSEQMGIPFVHQENSDYFDFTRESLMPFKVSTEGPKLAVGDVNGDGLDDFYVGGAKRQAGSLILQQPSGRFLVSNQPDFRADSTFEDVDALFFNADGDSDLDLYVVSGGNEFSGKSPQLADRLYLNDGKPVPHFSRAPDALPPMFANKSCVRPVDIDRDGDLDLFVGGRVVAFNYGKSPDSYLLINDGRGNFTDQTTARAPGLRQAGMVTDAVWLDVDNDNDPDLVVAGDWMPIRVFRNEKGMLSGGKPIADGPMSGFWQCLLAADFDNDGDTDLMAGNLGTNTKFRKDPGSDAPGPMLKMWVKDVDNNQSVEQILAYQHDNDWFPVAFRDELGKQIPGIINKRFTDYVSFAGKPISELFRGDELAGANELLVDQFASVYLENQRGTFIKRELPLAAQVSKLFTLRAFDIDADGDLDVLGGGNFYGVSPYQGRYDASNGLVLRNDGRGRFVSLSPFDAGFVLNGEIRDIKIANTRTGPLVIAARNAASLQVFRPLLDRKAQTSR
ncbi:MAG: VCBS repeat-containing protein [Bacteroidetes bacterium]|nr:VCBS repeat-containing protein [Fibrella sp.]